MSGPDAAFVDRLRDALLHIYDLGSLHAHPLRSWLPPAEAAVSGSRLRQTLLDAIETLRPGSDIAPTARAWRLQTILELRYVECRDVAEVMEAVALSSAQYHREQQRALQMLAAALWETWQGSAQLPDSLPGGDQDGDVRREAASLLHVHSVGQVDLAGLVGDLVQLVRPLCERRGVRLQVGSLAGLPPLAGERVAVRQAMIALLAHSLEAMVNSDLRLEAMPAADSIELCVRVPAVVPADAVARAEAESRPFVEALGGSVAVFRRPDRAWELTVRLATAKRQTLLVVDNSPDFIRLTERYLADSEWLVVGAASVEEAATLARERHPDAILLDVIIPGRDGWEFLLELREHAHTAHIPVYVCSVLHEPAMAVSLGARGYLQKPVRRDDLVAALSAID